MDRSDVAAVVLAAGKGTRLRSDRAKVLHEVAGRTLVGHVLEALRPLGLGQVVVVVGHQRDEVIAEVERLVVPATSCVVQQPQHGTGHAVEVAMEAIDEDTARVIVINGDAPLLTTRTLAALADHAAEAATILTTHLEEPAGYGRVLRGEDGTVVGVVEHADATEDQRLVSEVNAGMYAFDAGTLPGLLARIGDANEQGERYVTDVVGLLVESGEVVHGLTAPADDVAGVNDREQLAAAGAVLRDRHLARLQAAGVTVVDPTSTWVDVTVEVGSDTTILPGCLLQGRTSIGRHVTVGPTSHLVDTTVRDGARVRQSVCDRAEIGEDAEVGPFTHLRPGAVLHRRARTGAYVEVKKSTIGRGSKVPHLAYVGDATVGDDVNLACGVVTVNYDGFEKHHTTIGDGAFVGCDTMLVAPITVGDGAFVAAGSVLTEDVPPDALAIARGRQVNKGGWAADRRARRANP